MKQERDPHIVGIAVISVIGSLVVAVALPFYLATSNIMHPRPTLQHQKQLEEALSNFNLPVTAKELYYIDLDTNARIFTGQINSADAQHVAVRDNQIVTHDSGQPSLQGESWYGLYSVRTKQDGGQTYFVFVFNSTKYEFEHGRNRAVDLILTKPRSKWPGQ